MKTTIIIPTLETERLTLRAANVDDYDRFVSYFAHESSWFTGGPCDAIEAYRRLMWVAGSWVLKDVGLFVVADRKTNVCLGTCGAYTPPDWPENEIGWWLHPDARGRRLATEAAIAVRTFLYRFGWHTAFSYIHPTNEASKSVANRLGAKLEKIEPIRGEDHEVWRHPSPENLGIAA